MKAPNPIKVVVENREACGANVTFVLASDPTVQQSVYVAAGGTQDVYIQQPGRYGIAAQMDAPCQNPTPTTGDIQPPGPYSVVIDRGRVIFG